MLAAQLAQVVPGCVRLCLQPLPARPLRLVTPSATPFRTIFFMLPNLYLKICLVLFFLPYDTSQESGFFIKAHNKPS